MIEDFNASFKQVYMNSYSQYIIYIPNKAIRAILHIRAFQINSKYKFRELISSLKTHLNIVCPVWIK